MLIATNGSGILKILGNEYFRNMRRKKERNFSCRITNLSFLSFFFTPEK